MLKAVALILAMRVGGAASAREIVKVGGYEFGPFVDLDTADKPGGLAVPNAPIGLPRDQRKQPPDGRRWHQSNSS
ncbi:MAG: hypothetical protein EPN20_05060 [Magnetospirillum sp.]|nr:MAG: hypothetical protein EPN20_05060 [Magnetospirillum sp.]